MKLWNRIIFEDKKVKKYLNFPVLDLAAWVTTWVMAMGAYSGRQERPYRREFEELEDMPEVFIPSELTGNQIERAFRMAGTKQAVPEINEVSR